MSLSYCFQQMIQITEQLTENCFTVINFNNIAFRFHPNKTIDEIRKRLQSDNDHTEIVLTHSTGMRGSYANVHSFFQRATQS